jgi:catechol 2,3-dioxygenase-like lactoylglutathione lyase family enzyme
MRMGRSLDVAIVTRSSSRLVGFYREVLGLEVVGEIRVSGAVPDGLLTRLSAGGSTLKILQFDAEPGEDAPRGAPADATGLRYLTVGVEDLVTALKACGDAGIEVALPLTVLNADLAIAFVHDPDGNVVELVGPAPQDP